MSNVNHPKHYSLDIHCECGKNIECLDIVKNLPFVDGNIIKYVWRWRQKNGIEDLHKAKFYLNELIKSVQEQKLKATRNTLINDLDLNARTKNCLLADSLHTIEDILNLAFKTGDKRALQRIPNFGKKSYNLLSDELTKHGFVIPKWKS
jgi:DNA-directed RNA polymerase alpha subunit